MNSPIAVAAFIVSLIFVCGWLVPAALVCGGFAPPCFDRAFGLPIQEQEEP
jgi:hypothetical protein